MNVSHGTTSQLFSCVVFCGHRLLLFFLVDCYVCCWLLSFVIATPSSICADGDGDGYVTETTMAYIIVTLLFGSASWLSKRIPASVVQRKRKSVDSIFEELGRYLMPRAYRMLEWSFWALRSRVVPGLGGPVQYWAVTQFFLKSNYWKVIILRFLIFFWWAISLYTATGPY